MGLAGEAGAAEEAIALAEREHPDVVLVGLDSREDTFSCVEHLVAAHGSRIIVLSDRQRRPDHPALIELGAVGFVLAQDAPEVLIKAIQKVHAGEVWIDRVNTAQALGQIARHRHAEDLEAGKIAALTRREREIILLVGEGLKNAGIAQRLFVSEATVRNHLTSILDKLGLTDRFELAVYAFRHGLVEYANRRPRRPGI